MTDGFVNPAKRDCVACILALLNSRYARRRSRFNRASHCDILSVRLIPQALRALKFELFTSPSNLDFLRDHDE
jgi:hypothetical protein